MDPKTSRLNHNNRSPDIVFTEPIQIFFYGLDERPNGAPMESSKENEAGMGSRGIHEDARQSQIAREKD